AAIKELDDDPDNEDNREILRLQLKKLLAEDHPLLEEARTVVVQMVHLSYGERSVAVGGEVKNSTIITGDGNRL
ncbi:MAG: hypothetical protein AB1453_16555, partial [Chloroflexota bacterium]